MTSALKNNVMLSAWIESLIITLVFITLSLVIHNPLSLKSSFPWIWFAPVLIALRYGLWPSQCSIMLLLLSYLYHDLTPLTTVDFQLFILGGFTLTVVCIIAHSSWSRKAQSERGISHYLQQRIQSIAHAYKIVSLAYQRIEQEYIIQPVSIRSSLVELREMLAKHKKQEKTILNRLLNILALQCTLETAGIFPVENNQIIPKAITSIGNIKPPDADNFLIQACLEHANITHIHAKEVLNEQDNNTLIVAPFINQQHEIYALLIVQDMPFLSLNHENIETIHLLLSYYLEGHTVRHAELILKHYPDCPIDFANELQRLTHVYKTTQQDSGLVALVFPEGLHQNDYLFRLKQESRGIDSVWEITQKNTKILLILMPMTQPVRIDGYKTRINLILDHEFGTALNQDKIKIKTCQLSSVHDPIHLIHDVLTTS